MAHVVALNGQWEGLRAIPRTLRTPDHKKRLEDGLERLGGLFEQMAHRAAMLAAGMDRLNGLRASMIDQLDAIDADPDLEPSLAHPEVGHWLSQAHSSTTLPLGDAEWTDLEEACEDEGAVEEDDDREREANLCGVTFGHGHAVNLGPAGGITFDLEDQCEDEGHDSDREPDDEFGNLS